MSSTVSPNPTANTVLDSAEDAGESPTNQSIDDNTTTAQLPKAASPATRKRASSDPPLEERNSKRSKDTPPVCPSKNGHATAAPFPSPTNNPATTRDKQTWQGFCEIESDPAYFSVILREMGVQGVTVREVLTMDQSYLKELLPQPIYGLILLFHYREFGNADQPAECPANVWFANQLPGQASCATLAMINILMNSSEVGVGEHLNQFKDFTRDFTPYQRGEALASFDFVKKIHNSFAKKMDILESDKYLSSKVSKAQRLQKEKTDAASKKGKGTKSRTRRASADTTATDDSAESHEESAHHFLAFVPVGNEVWKLDGLDAQPTCMGTFDPSKGETWLSAVSDTIAALMAAGDDDYGVIALTHSPLLSLRNKACLVINTTTHVESRLASLDKDWRSFVLADAEPPSPSMLGVEHQLASHPLPDALTSAIDEEKMQGLLERRSGLVKQLGDLAASIMAEIQQEAEEEQKAAQRRYDCGPVIKKWLEMLAGNGHLEHNLDRFMPAATGKKTAAKEKGKGK